MRCTTTGCTREARPRVGRMGPPPRKCAEHAPPAARTATANRLLQVPQGAGAVTAAPAPAAVRQAVATFPVEKRQALERQLREIARGAKAALDLLGASGCPWTCPRCGPLARQPLFDGAAMHCPNDGCDEIVKLTGEDEPKKGGLGDAWRNYPKTSAAPRG